MKSIPHQTVLLEETVSQVFSNPNGIYLDGTIGFGGHAEALLKKLSKHGKLIGIDLDPYALEYTKKRLSSLQKSYSLHNRNFREYPNLLQSLEVDKLTGIIFDLGSSSSQLNTEHRGFSFQTDAPLDMRFNPKSGTTAAEFLNNSDKRTIGKIIKIYGEERHYHKIANFIFKAVQLGRMNTTIDLKNAVSKCVHPKFLTKSLARVFQAIRIKINDELESLKDALNSSTDYLEEGGRIAVISFHSLEDRIVKQFFNNCTIKCICPSNSPICICNTKPTLKIINKRVIIPDENEIKGNPRSRSAKLRVAEKV